jgi:EAL domain-containing protein (putative c-di-GMP-specific phosphodiesterase class I)
VLKIDKSLTSRLLDDPRDAAITKAVTQLGADLGLSVVVEGIESHEVARLVEDMGAQYGQGSLFGRPCRLADVPGLGMVKALPVTPLPRAGYDSPAAPHLAAIKESASLRGPRGIAAGGERTG